MMTRTYVLAIAFTLALASSLYGVPPTLEWTRQLGTSGIDQSLGVSADSLGNVYISGSTDGSLGGPNAGSGDVFLVKFSDGVVPEPTSFLLAGLTVISASVT